MPFDRRRPISTFISTGGTTGIGIRRSKDLQDIGKSLDRGQQFGEPIDFAVFNARKE
jgi:hypothetical protein